MTTYESVTGRRPELEGRQEDEQQADVLGKDSSLFPLKNPALISMPLAFVTGIVVSLMTRDAEAEKRFYEAERRIVIGAPPRAVPMETAVAHRRPTG
jgi:cation/acetate symporter